MPDTYLVNGVDLSGLAWTIETSEGLQDAPDFRGDELVLPGIHGAIDVHADPTLPRRRYATGQITFDMWVIGVDPVTGVVPASSRDAYYARLGTLQRLFNARTLLIDRTRSDGTRRASARLAAPLRPKPRPGSPDFGRFTAVCTIPGAFWTGTADITVSASLATGGVLDLSAFDDCDAPITDGIVTFGAGSNPSFIQGGTFLAYDAVISTGQELAVDCSDWSLSSGAGTAWTPTASALRYGPGPSWFEFDPTQTPPAAVLAHTGGGSMPVAFTARPKYLTS